MRKSLDFLKKMYFHDFSDFFEKFSEIFDRFMVFMILHDFMIRDYSYFYNPRIFIFFRSCEPTSMFDISLTGACCSSVTTVFFAHPVVLSTTTIG